MQDLQCCHPNPGRRDHATGEQVSAVTLAKR